MPCEASSQRVFFSYENPMRSSQSGGEAGGGTCGTDRGSKTGACGADQWFESSRRLLSNHWSLCQPLRWIPQKVEVTSTFWGIHLNGPGNGMKFDGVPLEVSLRDERSLLAHAFACHQVRLETLARSSEFHREGRRLGTKRGRATPGSVRRLGAKNVDIEAPWIREFLMEFLSYSPCLCGVLVFVCLPVMAVM